MARERERVPKPFFLGGNNENVDERMEWEESFLSYNFSSLFHPTKVQHLQPKIEN